MCCAGAELPVESLKTDTSGTVEGVGTDTAAVQSVSSWG
jgi:hypothetical protein